MKKTILREVIWFFVTILLSVPLSFVFLYFLKLTSSQPTLNEVEKVFTIQLFLIGMLVMFLCIYVVRLIALGIKTLLGGESGKANP
jgi:RsiW-degrading membrane proteinase PrsW (M82 family)